MKKIISLLLVMVMALLMTACNNETPNDIGEQGNGETTVTDVFNQEAIKYTGTVGEKRTLANTYRCLTQDKKLNVAYIGGSVTNGYGGTKPWRTLTTQWLKDKYPGAEIVETNAGRGGTSSMWGLARLENEVLAKNPDLVFIEFAINDSYASLSEMESATFIDAMIRKINEKNANTDIIIVFVTDNSKLDTEYSNVKGHRTVAEYYGIPCIDVGKKVIEKINTTDNKWDYYFGDSVHPNDNGYKVYGDEVCRVLDELLASAKKETAKPHDIGGTGATTSTIKDVKSIAVEKLSYNEDWRYRATAKVSIGNKSELAAKNDGATLEFEFEGSFIGCVFNAKKNGNIKVWIDGGNEKTFNMSGDTAGCLERIFYNNLTNGKHTIKIEYVGPGYFALSTLLVG